MSHERLVTPAEGGEGGGPVEHSATLAAPLMQRELKQDEEAAGMNAVSTNGARRGLLVLNPKATTASERTSEVLVGALSSALDLRAVRTERRGHAAELARSAMDDGADVVIVFGGDGTVNEVVNGLLSHGPGPHVPSLAVIPGGSTNVFARALGLPNDAVEATGALLRYLRERRTRLVSVGAALADEANGTRYFTFTAGYGFDAAVTCEVERQRAAGRRASGALYIRLSLSEYFRRTDRKNAPITATLADGTELQPLFMAALSNTAPWTYLGNRPILATPDAGFETGLDLFGLANFAPLPVALNVGRLIANSRRLADGPGVLIRHDLAELTLSAQRPVAFEVDGDYLGPRERVTLRSVPDALRVFA
jgi:diacylglycerol kinase family enzyme